ncbi:LacI family DNA-binding transcriptional regulator [Carboxydochorda subterranea]|uniref:LacI family DNA-binding transcriptional regulator n=1 Tax=Carboxydichorda subterranea TaxID=3109565 RepID=A0ABZ1BXK9_9FIRM|nr:LacI family DNA-binding transcriptional regulator [Limnochorda sp. L945t]WRP17545.1 LacI family DNA-binding transcriptional regulator [Limnochorda sp. L945t]
MVTLADIARRLGVSTMTVSRALNGRDGVSEELRRRVLEEAERLGYSKNLLSVALRRGKTRTVGLCVFDLSFPYANELVREVDHLARAAGYEVLVNCSHGDAKEERENVEAFLRRRVDGMLIVPVASGHNVQFFKRLAHRGVPLVFVDRYLAGCPVDYVATDNIQGGFLATSHLLELGHRKIAFVPGPEIDCIAVQDRLVGAERALAPYGDGANLTVLQPQRPVPRPEDNGYEAVRDYLRGGGRSEGGRLTAVFAVNDSVAMGVVAALREHGVRVPEEMSVVGFDDISMAKYFQPPLTTIRQDAQGIGQSSIRMLLELMDGRRPSGRRLLLEPVLVERATTAPVAGSGAEASGASGHRSSTEAVTQR